MNKFLWRLFGIEDEEEFVDLSRRGFLKGVGAAAVLGAAGPKYFLAPAGGWVAPSPNFAPILTLEDLNSVSVNYIIPMLTDNVFKANPIFTRLMKSQRRSYGIRVRG